MTPPKSKLVYFGSPNFSAHTVYALAQQYPVVLVVTQPDSLQGRKKILTPTPVKLIAKKLGLRVFDGTNLGELASIISQLKPDIGILFGYGKILPTQVLQLFMHGILNLHPSLLPRYRGAAPVQWAVHDGVAKTGVTIIRLDHELDHGPMVAQLPTAIRPEENAYQLNLRLAEQGTQLLITILPQYLAGKIDLQPQDDTQATYCRPLRRTDGLVNWRNSAQSIYRAYLAFMPWPGIYTVIHKNHIILENIQIVVQKNTTPGKITVLPPNHELVIECGQDALKILQLKPAGKKSMSGREYIIGHQAILNK